MKMKPPMQTVQCSNCNVDINDNQVKAIVVEYEEQSMIEVQAICPLCKTKHNTLIELSEVISSAGASLHKQ
jgi:hypothetical protein